ncbi:MAG: PilZ domain-containing protein [Halioglobus sp.]
MSDNKRNHIRIKMDAQVYVELAAATDTAEAELERCTVEDVSFGGMRVLMNTEVTEGAILAICAELPSMPEPFFMAAEVMWCRRQHKDNNWLAGFALIPSSDSDLSSWRELLEHV